MRLPAKKLAFVLFFLLWSSGMEARSTSLDVLRFRPATDLGNYFQLYGADLLQPREWTAGLFLDYARNPLVALNAAGDRAPVVRDVIGGHLAGAAGILEWLEVGVAPQFALYEKFFDPVTRAESARVRMGDTRLNAKIRLLSREESPVGIALIPYLDLPTGSGGSFVGNNSLAGGGVFALESRQVEERLTFAMNLGYYARDRVAVIGTPFGDLLTFGVSGNFLVVRWLELIAEFQGGTMPSGLSTAGTPFEGGGGARYFIGRDRRWQVTTAVFSGIGSGLGNPSIRGLIGVGYTPPRRVRGVEIQESASEAFRVYELKVEGEMEHLKRICPDKKQFRKDQDDPRCIKLYLNQ